jgi:hypothetical protein
MYAGIDQLSNDQFKKLDNVLYNDDDYNVFSYKECPYIDPLTGFNMHHLGDKSQFLNVMHVNIMSLSKKKPRLLNLLTMLKSNHVEISVIMICETFMNDANFNECKIPGFTMYKNYRTTATRGGVAILVRSNLPCKPRLDLNVMIKGLFESSCVEITFNGQIYIFSEIYRKPGGDLQIFKTEYKKLMNTAIFEKKKLIIGTNQNLDYLKLHSHPFTDAFFH